MFVEVLGKIRAKVETAVPDRRDLTQIEFTFVMSLDGKQRALPTYGVVIRNDASGLEVRYNAPVMRWRDILARLIAEDTRTPPPAPTPARK